MNNTIIYSIGHGNKNISDFMDELNAYDIKYLIDIRSKPYSKYNPQYNKNELKFFLKDQGVTYVFLGDKLGGLPNDSSCYTDGKVDYDILKDKEFFLEGLQRVINAYKNGVKVVIMCSESKPQECHRSKLIGRELMKKKITVAHIIGKGKVKDQSTVILEVTKGLGEQDLFGKETNLTSRKKKTFNDLPSTSLVEYPVHL